MRKNLIFILIIAILLVICSFSLQYGCNKNRELESSNNLNKALTDTAKIYRDKDNLWHIERSKFEGDRKQLLEIAEKKDKEIAKLLKDKKTNSVIQFTSNTDIDTVIGVEFTDTGSCNFTDTIINDWYTVNLSLIDKSLSLDLSIKNKYTITDKWKRDKWYQKKYSVIDIKNNNPYSKSDSLVVYTIKTPKKNRTVWVITGAVVLGTVLLLK